MNLRSLTRHLALRIPRVRRYYDYVNGLSAAHSAAVQEAALLKAEIEKLRSVRQEEAPPPERDELELQLYVTRADYQRTVRLADRYRSRLKDVSAERDRLVQEIRVLEQGLGNGRAASGRDTATELPVGDALLNGPLRETLATIRAELRDLHIRLASVSQGESSGTHLRDLYLDLASNVLSGQGNAALAHSLSDEPAGCPAAFRRLRRLAEGVLQRNVPGDFVATGPETAAAGLFLRAVLAAHGIRDRRVRIVEPTGASPRDPSGPREATERDEPHGGRIALIHLGQGTAVEVLAGIYPNLAAGGCILLDDGPADRRPAIEVFKEKAGIGDALKRIDDAGLSWQKNG